jgi:hypothetical protein
MKFVFILLSTFSLTFLSAQHINFNSQKNWSLNKKELIFGMGATQFTGDLGGGPTEGIDYSMKDIDFPSTGINAMIGFRYRFHPSFATTTKLSCFTLKGDDKFSEESIRNARNLNFKTGVFELQQRIEWIAFSVEKFSPTYTLPGKAKGKNKNQQYYLFTGLGAAYFNPKAEYNGKWYELRKLRTEGQAKPYSPITMTIPMGLGLRFGLGTSWRFGIEASYVKTFSDYIDDVSTVYADPNSFSDPVASVLSNPSDLSVTVGNGFNWFGAGYQRGDSKQMDAFYQLNFVITRNITYKDYGRQRSKSISKSFGRYKV